MASVMEREKTTWIVVMARKEDGAIVEKEFSSYWKWDTDLSEIANSCAAQHSFENRDKYIPMSAYLKGEENASDEEAISS